MAPRIISVIGSLNIDFIMVTRRFPSAGESVTAASFVCTSGGKGANQALAAVRSSRPNPKRMPIWESPGPVKTAEIEVRMIGAVGTDEYGPRVVKPLADDGVDISGVRKVQGELTGVAVVLVESDTKENRVLLSPGANHSLHPEDFLARESLAGGLADQAYSKPDLLVLQLEISLKTVEQILETARNDGVDVVLNAAPAPALLRRTYHSITHLIVNETEAATLYGRRLEDIKRAGGPGVWGPVMDEFLRRGVKNVVITLGAEGACYSHKSGEGGHVETEGGVRVVDTTGAGNAFVGAYAVEVVRMKESGLWDMKQAVRQACKAAAKTTEKIGSQEGIPWADEVGHV
jgi:ribokinase